MKQRAELKASRGRYRASSGRWGHDALRDQISDDDQRQAHRQSAVEGFFAILTKRRLRRGVFRTVVTCQRSAHDGWT
jgi:hypothetical protein